MKVRTQYKWIEVRRGIRTNHHTRLPSDQTPRYAMNVYLTELVR